MSTISKIEASELGELSPIAEHFFSEADLVGGFVQERFIEAWTAFISSGTGVIFAIRNEDKIIGVLGAIKYPDINDGEIVCSEAFWYVDKDSRGEGLSLLKRFEEWAKEEGAKRLTMVHLVDSMPDKLSALYERMGYSKKEVIYIKKI